jgi:hypothetical protein
MKGGRERERLREIKCLPKGFCSEIEEQEGGTGSA